MSSIQAARPATTGISPLDEIRSLVRDHLPALAEIGIACRPLGDLEPAWRWLATAQQKAKPSLQRPRIAVFLSVAETSREEISASLSAFQSGAHPVTPLAQEANADLQVYELGQEDRAPGEAETAQALAYGMMAVQPGIDLLVLCAPSTSAEVAAEKILRELDSGADPFEALLRCGGVDIAALTGALIAARLARTPVLLEGRAADAAAAVLEKARAGAALHARSAASLLAEKTALAAPCRAVLLIPLLKSIIRAAG